MTRKNHILSWFLGAVLSVGACGGCGDKSTDGDADATEDTGVVDSTDMVDTSEDTPMDTSPDLEPDTAIDTAVDTPTDEVDEDPVEDVEAELPPGYCETLADCPDDLAPPGYICLDHECVASPVPMVFDTEWDRPWWEDSPTSSGELVKDIYYSGIDDEAFFLVIRYSIDHDMSTEVITALDASGSTHSVHSGSNEYTELAGAHTSTFPLTLASGDDTRGSKMLWIRHGGSTMEVDLRTECASYLDDPTTTNIVDLHIRPGDGTYEIFAALDFMDADPVIKLTIDGSTVTCSSVLSTHVQIEKVSSTSEAVYSTGNGMYRNSTEISSVSFTDRLSQNHQGTDHLFAGEAMDAYDIQGSTVSNIDIPVSPWTPSSGVSVQDIDFCDGDKLVIAARGFLIVNDTSSSSWYIVEYGNAGIASAEFACSPDNDTVYIATEYNVAGEINRSLIYGFDLGDAIADRGETI